MVEKYSIGPEKVLCQSFQTVLDVLLIAVDLVDLEWNVEVADVEVHLLKETAKNATLETGNAKDHFHRFQAKLHEETVAFEATMDHVSLANKEIHHLGVRVDLKTDLVHLVKDLLQLNDNLLLLIVILLGEIGCDQMQLSRPNRPHQTLASHLHQNQPMSDPS